jgi:hypothetical protein
MRAELFKRYWKLETEEEKENSLVSASRLIGTQTSDRALARDSYKPRRPAAAAQAQCSLGQRQQIGSRALAPARRAPLVLVVWQHQQLVAERQNGGALREGRRHAEVSWDLIEPRDR